MPIYAYKCASCGFAKDVLQKLSDPPLSVCLQCGEPQFTKQVTAAGFQLKGSGWYVTDFRGDNKPKADASTAAGDAAVTKTTPPDASGATSSSSGESGASSASTAASPTPSAGATPSSAGSAGSASSSSASASAPSTSSTPKSAP